MKNHAKIEIPDPAEQLSIGEAVRVIQAMAFDMMATEKYLARLETVLAKCKAHFEGTDAPLLREIEDALK